MAISEKLKPLGEKVEKLREKGKEWSDIADDLSISTGKAMLAFEFATVSPKDKIKAKPDSTDMAKAIVRLRDKENLSWGRISARADLPESRCRKIYEEQTDTSTLGNRIGKGGRYPGGGGAKKPAAKKAAAKKGTAKKAPAKKAAAKKAGGGKPTRVDLPDMDEKQITARLTGKSVTVEDEDGDKIRYKVKKVTKLSSGKLTFVDSRTGDTETIEVENIIAASK